MLFAARRCGTTEEHSIQPRTVQSAMVQQENALSLALALRFNRLEAAQRQEAENEHHVLTEVQSKTAFQ